MSGSFRNLIAKFLPKATVKPDDQARDTYPLAVAHSLNDEESGQVTAGSWECEEMEPEYDEFRAKFCFAPGKKLMDLVEAEGYAELTDWLHWSNKEAEPKAFVRMMLTLVHNGEDIWDQPGIRVFLDGRWSRGGPSEETGKALKQLAQILDMRIELIHTTAPDNEDIWQLVFEP